MRLNDWPVRLDAVLTRYRSGVFEWGKQDCVTFAFDVIEAMTGERIPVPVTWTDEASAMRCIADHGGIVRGISAFLGEPGPAVFATTGDIGVIDVDGQEGLCVCAGQAWLALGESGLRVVDKALSCWRL